MNDPDLESLVATDKSVGNEQLERIGDGSVSSFQQYAAIGLTIQRKTLLSGSYTAHCSGVIRAQLRLSVEVAIMLWVGNRGEDPRLSAEMLYFAHGERIGKTEWGGQSYYSFVFDSQAGWRPNGTSMDEDEGWKQILHTRFDVFGCTGK